MGTVAATAKPASSRVSRRMSPTTLPRRAPSAMRMPISRVRCAVE